MFPAEEEAGSNIWHKRKWRGSQHHHIPQSLQWLRLPKSLDLHDQNFMVYTNCMPNDSSVHTTIGRIRPKAEAQSSRIFSM